MIRIKSIPLLVGSLAGVAGYSQSQAEADERQQQADQKARWMKEESNWGRWGKDDQLGTLNLLTPAKRIQAFALVKKGTVVSLSRKISLPSGANPLDAKGQPIMTDFGDIHFRRDGIPPPGQQPSGLEWNIDRQTFAYHGNEFTPQATISCSSTRWAHILSTTVTLVRWLRQPHNSTVGSFC